MKRLALCAFLLFPTTLRIAPSGDDSALTIPGGWRGFTSRPVAFVTDPGFEHQVVMGLEPDSAYVGWVVMPFPRQIGAWTCGPNGCIEFMTVGQCIVVVERAPAVRTSVPVIVPGGH